MSVNTFHAEFVLYFLPLLARLNLVDSEFGSIKGEFSLLWTDRCLFLRTSRNSPVRDHELFPPLTEFRLNLFSKEKRKRKLLKEIELFCFYLAAKGKNVRFEAFACQK